ncbi:hypothetical protein HMN09_01181600 [Mycena chlorophos]|uniref:DUF6532 domain-containing protein n=1 Tax=Mycena chlorophos TaxID=658473 RepID=A0A8H6S6M3_MYCCL|nr:hypothetical protein HMN09_01181600 [Mycena chlorophos]
MSSIPQSFSSSSPMALRPPPKKYIESSDDEDEENEDDEQAQPVPPKPKPTGTRTSTRDRQASSKQKENDKDARKKADDKLAAMQKQIAQLQKDKAHLAGELRKRDSDSVPPEEEEQDDIPLSRYNASIASKGVFGAEKAPQKAKAVKRRGHDEPIVFMSTRVPLEDIDRNAAGAVDDVEMGDSSRPHSDQEDDGSRVLIPSKRRPLRDPSPSMSPDRQPAPTPTRERSPVRSSSLPRSSSQGRSSRGRSPTPRRSSRASSPEPARPRKKGRKSKTADPPRKAEFVAGAPPKRLRTHRRDLATNDAAHVALAQYLFEMRIWVVCAFPDLALKKLWVVDIWLEVEKQLGAMELTDRLQKMVTKYDSHARGTVVTIARQIVPVHFKLQTGTSEDIKKEASKLLTDAAFRFQDPGARTGTMKNDILRMLIKAIWFRNSEGRGVAHSKYFSPISVPTLALLFTAIEFCIKMYETGEALTDVTFHASSQKREYEKHLKKISEWDALVPPMSAALRQELHDDCRKRAGAAPIVEAPRGLADSDRENAMRELLAMQAEMAAV